MNDTLYISATAAFCFVLLALHMNHIYNVGLDSYFETYKRNYEKSQERKARSDYIHYIFGIWFLTAFSGVTMIIFFAFWFKATQL
jgi:hypothetical protein